MFNQKTKYQYKKTKPGHKSMYKFGELHKNPVFLRLFTLVFTLGLVGSVFVFLPSDADATNTHPVLTQEGYVFENDDISWHDKLWSNRKKITIDNTKVPSDQTNFPVLIYRTDADWRDTANGGNVGQSDGGDILFTSSNGITKLDHEIESYVPSTGELVAWVKVPVVSGMTDTELYIYYGNASATDQWNIAGTWSDGFASVWHLDESPADGTAGGHDDSAGPNDGTPNNFQDAGGGTTNATGKINGANNFDGNNDVVTTGNSSTPTTALSLSAWVTPDTVSGTDRGIIAKENNFVLEIESDLGMRCVNFAIYSGGFLRQIEPAADCIAASETAYFTGTYDAATRVISVYKNGSLIDTGDFGSGSENIDNNTAIPIHIGFNPFQSNRYFDGIIDEVRVSNVVRSLDWIQTEYNNMDAPSTFYSVGSQETPSNSVMAGSQFSSGKTLDAVRQGERINLRTQITNSGSAFGANDELALFYDRNDGIWTKVQHNGLPKTSTGNCDSDNNFGCTTIDSSTTFGEDTDIAIDKSGSAWVSYFDSTNNEEKLRVANYVGAGGNCTDSAWACTTVDSSVDSGDYSSVAIDQSGNPWVSYRDRQNSDLKVARYVGSGGSCTATAWDCVTVDSSSSNVGQRTSIAFDSAGAAWISYWDFTNETLKVAKYVGTGGNCTSSAWDCTTVDDAQTHVGQRTSIVIDNAGNPWVSYLEHTNNNLRVANYVGSGGNCTDSAWDCTTVDSTVSTIGYFTSISVDPDGNAWVSYQDLTNTNLKVANYVGSGGNCSSSAWNCATVDSSGANGADSSIAFSPGGDALVAYRDITNTALKLAKYVGSGGNCSNSAWDCGLVDNSADVGLDTAIAFDGNGNIWISYQDTTNDNLKIASTERSGEISIVPSTFLSDGDVLSSSHSDMVSPSDTVSKDDADCLAGSATWNDGVYFGAENGSGLSLPAGNSTLQCTEIVWTLDTSQALPGETYRFTVATKDSFRPDKGLWRGPASVAADGYPTLTIRSAKETSYRYSKGTLGAFDADCTNTNWGCSQIRTTGTVGRYGSMEVSPTGELWTIFYESTAVPFNIAIAKYVGSGGDCVSIGGSDAWDCSYLGSDHMNVYDIDLAFDNAGKPWVTFASNSTFNLIVAEYVGAGGSGALNCSSEWECVTVHGGGAFYPIHGYGASITTDDSGHPWVAYVSRTSSTVYEVRLAQYVGSGGNCDDSFSGSDAWQCHTTIQGSTGQKYVGDIGIDANGKVWVPYETSNNLHVGYTEYTSTGQLITTYIVVDNRASNVGSEASIAFNQSGNPIVSHGGSSLNVSEYVGSGGNCDAIGSGSDEWNCTTVHNAGTNAITSIAMDSSGNPWIAHRQFLSPNYIIKISRYVGSNGNCDDDGGSDAWQCEAVITDDTTKDAVNIVFNSSNQPSIYFWDSGNSDAEFAQLKNPLAKPSYLNLQPYDGDSAGSGDMKFRLTSGLAPGTDAYGTCGGNSGLMGYCGLYHPEGRLDSLTAAAGEKPMYTFSTRYDTNSYLPTANLYFQTNISPATQNVHLQVYRFGSSDGWETVSTYSSAGCDASNCLIRGLPSGTLSEYFEEDNGDYWVHFRVYQEESGSDMTFSVDSFKAEITPNSLRGGRVFREEISDPFGW